ncbi:MAG: hypothetical protein PVH40_08660 [Gemmatimonadales bacterium]|jgi:hypothetical protein
MDPQLYELIEPAIVFATLLGTAFGAKLLIWGKGPIRRAKPAEDHPALERRMAELEERLSGIAEQQEYRLAELEERLDFTERVLTQQRAEGPKGIRPPGPPSSAQ